MKRKGCKTTKKQIGKGENLRPATGNEGIKIPAKTVAKMRIAKSAKRSIVTRRGWRSVSLIWFRTYFPVPHGVPQFEMRLLGFAPILSQKRFFLPPILGKD
jgi:hypothetical protein